MSAGAKPESKRRNKGDLLAPIILILAPFLSFLHLHGRSPFALDSLLIMGTIVLLGSVAGVALSALRGRAVYLIPVTALLLIAVDLEFVADGHFRVIGAGVLIVAWILREHITSLAGITLSVLTMLTLLTGPQDAVEQTGAPQPAAPPTAESAARPPPVVHLVLDEHIGLGGFPDSPAGASARADVEARYQAAGFTVYPRAFSEYSLTANALPNALNFVTHDEHLEQLGGSGTPFPAVLPLNAYFSRMTELGYTTHVYQPAFVDLCESRAAPVATCATVPGNSLLTVERLGLSVPSRAGVVFRYWLANESYLYEKVRRVGARLGVPDQPAANARVGPGGALELLSRLEADLLAASDTDGNLYFAHLLVPHSPFFFDSDCDPTSHPLASDSENQEEVEAAYLAQVQCVSRMITDFLERVDGALGARAIVMVHGDHGARILPPPTRDEYGALDLRALADRYSAFFAIRTPTDDAPVDKSQISIRELIDQLSSSGFDPSTLQPGAASVFLDFERRGGLLERYAIPEGWLAGSD